MCSLVAVQDALSTDHVVLMAVSPLNPESLLRALGPYMLMGLCLIVFAECGLLIGFFLPGDSLLFTAGVFVASGVITTPLWLVCALLVLAASLGNICGYWIGRKAGPAIFTRADSRLFKREYVDRTHAFFDKHGARAVVLGRFVPVVRTFVTVTAGVGRMNVRSYLSYSVLGAIIWAAGVTVLGRWLGGFAFARNHIELVLLAVVGLSFVPVAIEFARSRQSSQGPTNT